MVSGGGFLLIMMTLVQIAPLKINPWSAIGSLIGKAINGDVMKKLDEMEKAQAETKANLDEHIRVDDERNADAIGSCFKDCRTPRRTSLRHCTRLTSTSTIAGCTRSMKTTGLCWQSRISSGRIWSGRRIKRRMKRDTI